jgi:hypothetical protein
MPYRMAFHEQVFFDAWTCLEIAIDALFFIDILVNMFSTYLNRDNEYERNLRKII